MRKNLHANVRHVGKDQNKEREYKGDQLYTNPWMKPGKSTLKKLEEGDASTMVGIERRELEPRFAEKPNLRRKKSLVVEGRRTFQSPQTCPQHFSEELEGFHVGATFFRRLVTFLVLTFQISIDNFLEKALFK